MKLIDYRVVDECAAYLARSNKPKLNPRLMPAGGKLFIGMGDWNINGGPVPLLEITGGLDTRVVLPSAKTEAIERIQEIDGVLYAPYTDPRDNQRPDIRGKHYFMARCVHGRWENTGAVGYDFTHVFGVVKFRHKVLAYGSRGYDGWVTDVHPTKTTDYLHLPRPDGSYLLRIKDARVEADVDGYPGVVYFFCEVWDPASPTPAHGWVYRWDGDNPPTLVTNPTEAGTAPRDGRAEQVWSQPPVPGVPIDTPALTGSVVYSRAKHNEVVYTLDHQGRLARWRKETT